jgi:hypothetical protein
MEYKSEKHKEIVEEFERSNVIAECRYGEGGTCYVGCCNFYNCWVKPVEEKESKPNKLEEEVDGMC